MAGGCNGESRSFPQNGGARGGAVFGVLVLGPFSFGSGPKPNVIVSAGDGAADGVVDVVVAFCLPAALGVFCCCWAPEPSAEDFASAFLASVFFRFSTALCISPRAHRPTREKLY